MNELTILSYNVQHQNRWFSSGQIIERKRKTAEAASCVIRSVQPHLVGICEAANQLTEHETFLDTYLADMEFRTALGKSRGG